MKTAWVWLVCFGLVAFTATGQSTYHLLENTSEYYVRRELNKMNVYAHPSIRPYQMHDSLVVNENQQRKALLSDLFSTPGELPPWRLVALPLAGYYYEKFSDTAVNHIMAGAMLQLSWKNKLTLYADYAAAKGSFSPFLIQRTDSLNIIPGNGYRYNNTPGKFFYENWNAYLSYSPNHFLNIQLGKGKNFWGYGYRSLFLSDNATNYPYAKFSASFWRMKYVSMVAQMKDIRFSGGDPSKYFTKYGTFHLLSWNVNKRLNINVFESVIWQAKDTLQNRQLDIHYLNPVIFFRPVEFALGSSDNSIIGFGAKFNINNDIHIYAQGLLDEFLLAQIRADSGWWANKYGLQIGLMAMEPFKIKGLSIQTEYNAVRPFTYSHGSVYQNYGHFNQPLAHPSGANFRDWVTIVQYRYKWFTLSNKLVIGNYGTDIGADSYGGNIYQSYRDRVKDYHNFIGQGINNELFMNQAGLEVLLARQNNFRIELGYVYRKLKNEFHVVNTNYIYFGIKTALYNFYNDF